MTLSDTAGRIGPNEKGCRKSDRPNSGSSSNRLSTLADSCRNTSTAAEFAGLLAVAASGAVRYDGNCLSNGDSCFIYRVIVVVMVETLSCNTCGAPLEVPESANFLKCNHCGQQLAVRRSDTATFTEAIDRLSQTAEAMSEHVEELSRQNKLTEIDRRWEQEREDYMVSDNHGHRHFPNEGGSLIGGVVISVFGCFWTAMAIGITSGAPSFGPFSIAKVAFPAFGVLFVVFGVIMSIRNHQKAKDYREAKRRYQAERSRIMNEA